MYKKAVGILFMIPCILLACFCCIAEIDRNRQLIEPVAFWQVEENVFAEEKEQVIGISREAASGQRVVDYQKLVRCEPILFSKEELDALYHIVESEAGIEDEEGKLLVANVVLNRVDSDCFPNTITEVVLQRENGVTQFAPVSNGRFWKVKISEETIRAVDRALEGEDISQGALFFVARKYADSQRIKWFDEKLTYLFTHGGHEFFSF